MGLLDDAIRDHIELKRKHGAQPDEIARLENEAFGSVRRGLDLDAGHEHGVGVQAAPHLHLAEDPIGAHLHDEPMLDGPPRPHGDPADAIPHVPAPIHLEPEDELFADEQPELQDEPPRPHGDPVFDEPEAPTTVHQPLQEAPRVDPGAPHHVEPVELQPTQAFDVEEVRRALDAEEPAGATPPADHEDEEGDELLEETPEFLQETPEHDRLWFEQRPPRDFDF